MASGWTECHSRLRLPAAPARIFCGDVRRHEIEHRLAVLRREGVEIDELAMRARARSATPVATMPP